MTESTIPERGFEKAEHLEAWLQTLTFRNNRGFGQILASRSAIRTMPNSVEIFKSARNLSEWRFEFLTSLFHHNLILLIHLKETDETKIQRLKTIHQFMNSTNQHVFMKINSYFAAANHAAASTVYAGGESPIDIGLPPSQVLKSIDYSVRSFRSAVRSKKKTSNTIRRAGYSAWAAVTADARMLEAGATPTQMSATPLWPADSPYKPSFDRKTFLATAPSFEVWLDWYEPIVDGKAPWGLPRDVADKLEMRIALGNGRGEGGKDFWDRDADEVNAEIKGWVDAARAEEALKPPKFAPGLQFGWLNRMIRLVRGLGLANPQDDQKRIGEQLSILKKLVGRLKTKLIQTETPCDGLQQATDDLFELLNRGNGVEVGVSELHGLTLVFRAELYEQQNPPFGRNTLPLSGSELATAESIATISDLIVLATEEGRKLFDDADRSANDAGGMEYYTELELRLLDILSEDGTIIEPESLQLIKSFLLAKGRGPYQIRTAHLADGSMLNATMVVAGVGVIGAIGYGLVAVPIVGIAAAYLGKLVLGEGIKKSALGVAFNENVTKQIDRATVEKIWANRDLIRQIAGNRPSHKWLLGILDWAERNKK
jgi:hypothetical protein